MVKDTGSAETVQQRAYAHWSSLMRELGIGAVCDDIFHDLIVRYSEKHRKYHTLQHIVNILDLFERVHFLSKYPMRILLALWFHDAYYETATLDPQKSNEEKSAELFLFYSKRLLCRGEEVEEVCRMIRLSTHKLDTVSDGINVQLFLDLDLSILGASWREFLLYEEGIRYEYHFVPRILYCKERIRILKSLVNRRPLYRTEYMRERYEKQARRNVARLCTNLQEELKKLDKNT